MLKKLLESHGQNIYKKLPLSKEITKELEEINWDIFAKQLCAVKEHTSKTKQAVSPLNPLTEPLSHTHPSPALRNKNIGCLIMAGGQATRLKMDTPKGIIPVSPLRHKSLLQIIAERVLAFSDCYETTVPLAIMTSTFSKQAIVDHFTENNFFGLPPGRVFFCAQESLPFLDMDSQLIIDSANGLAQGPNGNGMLFSTCSKVLQKWAQEQIEVVSIIQVDNPLIDPFHPAVLSPLFSGHDLTAAAIERNDPHEKVGIFVKKEGHTTVLEYSEFTPEQLSSAFKWANISFFASTIDFALKATTHTLPLHIAKKKFQGEDVWKAEYFIFDHLPLAQNPVIVPVDRSLFFSPVKNKDGNCSIETAQKAMIERDKNRLQELTGTSTSEIVELPQQAYYPTDTFVEKSKDS